MDELIRDLLRIERRIKKAQSLFVKDDIRTLMERLIQAAEGMRDVWSGSWLQSHSGMYQKTIQRRQDGVIFNDEWSVLDLIFSEDVKTGWKPYSHEEIRKEIMRRANHPDMAQLHIVEQEAQSTFESCAEEVKAILAAVCAGSQSNYLLELEDKFSKTHPYVTVDALEREARPKGVVIIREMRSATEKEIKTPAHIQFKLDILSIKSRHDSLGGLSKVARAARLFLEKTMNTKRNGSNKKPRSSGAIFIGHGRSPVWRDLKDLIQERFNLKPIEFNLEPAAGLTTKERLEEMLNDSDFAFLLMTAEDEHADTTRHARENVIHEVGLFQGRLGFKRAIVLLEEGCAEFSNIQGLGQIRFPKGNIKAQSEEIRRVLEREGLMK